MTTYPGLRGPVITDYLSRAESRARYAPGTEFEIAQISMIGNTGTYIDSPAHRYPDAADLAAMPLARTVNLDGILFRLTGSDHRDIQAPALQSAEVRGRAVLLHTGWDAYWGKSMYGSGEHPYLGVDAARWLVDHGAALVGIDSLNVDDASTGERPVHSLLLAAGIPIVEHMRGLEQLPAEGFRFFAAPLAIAGMVSVPVRAFAIMSRGVG